VRGLAAAGAACSDTGRVREVNEDRVLVLEHAGRGAALYVVADGLGGHAAGSVASALAVQVLRATVPALLAARVPPQEALIRAVRDANDEIRERATDPDRAGMATTCTALLCIGTEGLVVHVGDSRAYLLRGREIQQLTTDHSLVQELVRHGGVAPQDADAHAQRHVLTRALGVEPDVQPDVLTVPLRSGDVFCLTSDGVSGAVPAEEIAAVLRGTPDAEAACETLVGLANARGGLDNASAVVVRLRPRWAAVLARIAAPAALAAFLAVGVGVYQLEHSYFLGVSGGRVAVMRGVPARVLGVSLFTLVRVTAVGIGQVAPAYRASLTQGIPVRSPDEAQNLLDDLVRRP